MKIKNKNWIRLTTSIVIISLLYQNILLAEDKHLAPRPIFESDNKKGEMQAVMICETIENRAGYGRLIERIYLDDILKWAESSEEEFSGCRFETLPHEIKIHIASNNIIVRYFYPSKADSISGFKTKIIGPRLHRQIIHTHEPKALLAEKQDFKQPVIRKITPLSLLIIITASCLLISTFVFTFTSTLVLTSGAKLLFSMDIVRLLPSLAALLGGFGIGLWILKQIEYGMDLLRKEPAYDLLSRIVPPIREKPKKPVKFIEYEYKVITKQSIEAITLGIKLSDSEIERLKKLSSIEDNAHRYMLYYGTQVNKLAGIVIVKEAAHGIILVEVEWTSHEGKRQLSEDFIVTELANRNPAGILFHSADIDPEIIDRVLPNHSVADKKESARRLKEKVFSRLKIDDKWQYTFFATDKQDFRERRRFYFGSFRFSSLWKMAEIDHWIYSFANGLFFALVFSSIFAHAEAIKVLAEYSFFEEYINLILTVIVAPLAARSIAKVIRMRWDPVRSRHGRRGGEDIWLSITQNMRMGWKMIGTFKILAYSRIFLSATSLLLIPAIGVVILGISSAYVYLSLMFLKLVSDRIINEYEERYYKEVSEVAILFNEAAKREGYAENFHNIDSTSDILRELIYASALLIGYGIFTCSLLSPATIPLAILAAIAMPISSFLVPTLGRDYKNYLKMWGKGFTQQSGGRVLLAEGVTMTTNPDNQLVVHPRPVPVTDYFSILPWVEQLGVVIECKPGHIPIIEMKNPKWPRAKKGRCILEWPREKLKIELISREKPLDIRDITTEYKQDGGCIIRFYPRKSIKPSKGSPATLLQYMHNYEIFSNNPKRSIEMARQRGGNDSQRTIQRELKVLKAVGLVEGDRNAGYSLSDWLKSIKIEDIIRENTELNIADPSEKQIETVKRRIRSRSQTALFTMLNGVLRDFMPMVNASLVAVVLRHYPLKDASFAERLYDVIQRYSGLSSLEKLQEFNRLHLDDSIDDIPALAAEANELKKALSREAGISSTGQKLLELFQHDLAFTISVDSPDYIKEVMRSNSSLLNAQGLLVDTLGNTGKADYDKFSHIDKALSTYPDVKNVFLVFDAASEIKKARKIADRLKPQGKRVHVIGVVYPMSSATARKALKSALRQAGYSGSIDLDTLNLPDQSFDSLSKSLQDAGTDIVLNGLSSNLSQVMELYDRDKPELDGQMFISEFNILPYTNTKILKGIAQDVIQEFKRHLAEKHDLLINSHYKLVFSREGGILDISGITKDGSEERISISEAIQNAVDAIADEAERKGITYKGRIVLRIRSERDKLVIELEDNGTGIPHNVLKRLFRSSSFSTKPGTAAFRRIGSIGMGIGEIIGRFLHSYSGSIEFDTRHYETGAYRLYRKFGPDRNDWTIEKGNRKSIGTTVRWTLPESFVKAQTKDEQKVIAKRFVDTIRIMPAKSEARKIILALDTDIGNMTQFEIGELLRQIKEVSSLLGDIEFVAGAGDTLTGLIEDTKSRIKTHNIDVIVVTKKKKEDFDSSYYVVRTDDSRLDSGSYVPILELLTFALLINLENNDVLLREIYKEITGNELTSELKGQIKNGTFAIPLPPSEKISSDFYNTSIEVLKSA